MKRHQISENHTKTKYWVNRKEENHTKMQLILPIYEATPNQTNHTNTKILAKTKKHHTKIYLIAPRYKMTPKQTKSKQDENFDQDGEKSYQDSRDHHNVMRSFITWPHIRIISLKVLKSLQESHTNTQKSDQDIRFTPRRTWPTTCHLPKRLTFVVAWRGLHTHHWQTSRVCG